MEVSFRTGRRGKYSLKCGFERSEGGSSVIGRRYASEKWSGVVSLLAVTSRKEIMEHRDDTSGTNVNRVRDCFGFTAILCTRRRERERGR